jgi:predicted ester cyclase
MDPPPRDRDQYRPLPGFEPTGKPIDITVSGVVRIEDGRAAGHWGVADQLGVALQLGLFGPAGQPEH